MLSGETAVGKHPVETVQMMNDIIRFTEKSQKRENI
jgi:pyruvate kinase